MEARLAAERRIEAALRRVREELNAANLLSGRAAPAPATDAPDTDATLAHDAPGPDADAAALAPVRRAPAGTAAPGGTPTPAPPAAAPSTPAASPVSTPPVASAAATQTDVAPLVPSAATAPTAAAPSDVTPAAEAAACPPAAASLDPQRLAAARERLRAAAAGPVLVPLPEGTPTPWLTAALQRLLASDPETAGRIAVGILPAHAQAAARPLRCDLLLAGRGCLAVDLDPSGGATVAPRLAPRPRSATDLTITTDLAGFARLLYGRRTLRRPARVRGGRRALRELRRTARAPLGLRDLGSAGTTLEPLHALELVALAIDPAATAGERFAIAHAPLAGGPVDAWLRIADGAEPRAAATTPPEPVRLTLRCTRGALLAVIAGVEPPAGESGTLDGDDQALALLRTWLAQTEHPA